MNAKEFQQFYSRLNREQKEAVDSLDGPVMVVAGPGTGKTQVLILRTANIMLKGKAKPEEILALTFTDSGVSVMRERLISMLGQAAYHICISTFHSFCNEIIKENPDDFPQFFRKNLVDEISQVGIIEKVILNNNFKLLRPFGNNLMYAESLLNAFSDMKKEGVSPARLNEMVKQQEENFGIMEDLYNEKGPYKGKMKVKYRVLERDIEKNKEVVFAYKKYQEALLERGYDYDDIILCFIERLKSGNILLEKLQEKYRYIMADEHQDANQAQNMVIELLCSAEETPNIFVVGDEKQSIYRFQGANLANFLYFHTKFPMAKIITLKENYRSTQSILDAAGSVAKNNLRKLSGILTKEETGLFSQGIHPEKKVRVYAFKDTNLENYFVAKKIKKLIKSGVAPREISVLYRNNKDSVWIKDMLEKSGVACRVESDEDLLSGEEVRNLFRIMKAVSDFGNSENLSAILSIDFFGIPSLDAYKLIQPRQFLRHIKFNSIHDIMRSSKRMRDLGISKAIRISRAYGKLENLSRYVKDKSAPQALEAILRESGMLKHILLKDDYIERMARVGKLLQLSKRLSAENKYYSIGDFISHMELISAKNLKLRDVRLDIPKNAVRLMTAHRSKGLEFDYVFITGASYGHWGKRRDRKMLKLPLYENIGIGAQSNASYDAEDDERRLFYVALTRARKQVYISYPRLNYDGRELFPCQFITEISDESKEEGTSQIYEDSFARNYGVLFAEKKTPTVREEEKDFLRNIFQNRGLSPTALNNYISCPWKYFYNNLLQIPRAKTKHEMLGTAVHAALKDFFDVLRSKNEAQAGRDYLLECFEQALWKEPIGEHDFTESLEKGKESLARYYENYKDILYKNTVNEFGIKNILLADKVRITGKIDKIEILGNGEVNVVDYKTGKRKTRNALCGLTRNSTGNEKRQLVFYKILMDEMSQSAREKMGFKPIMVSGEIDFVEPEKRTGKLYKEKFVILEEEIRQLKDRILEVSDEILNFSFWERTCGDKGCEYCGMAEMMR